MNPVFQDPGSKEESTPSLFSRAIHSPRETLASALTSMGFHEDGTWARDPGTGGKQGL